MTSLGSTRVVPSYSMVGLSKAVVEALTRYLTAELAPTGIIANAISPGLVETDAAEMIVEQILMVDGGFSLLSDYFPAAKSPKKSLFGLWSVDWNMDIKINK